MEKKQGRKPIKQRPKASFEDAEFSSDITKISDELKAELKEQNYAYRWVDYLKMKTMDGYHPRGWQLYRRPKEKSDIIDNSEARLGSNPDRLIRRGTLVLAVRSEELNLKHKVYLRNRASRYAANAKAQRKEDLIRTAKQHNLDTTIVDGYEDK